MTDDPPSDVIDELVRDHRQVLALLERALAGVDPTKRRALADHAIAELVRHCVAEETCVHPAVQRHLPHARPSVDHYVNDHRRLEQIMKKLEGVRADDPRFEPLIRQLTEHLRHHVAEEESEEFRPLRAVAPRETLVDLRVKVTAAKKLAPTRPHPSAPRSEVFYRIAGPGVGLVDRLRARLSSSSL